MWWIFSSNLKSEGSGVYRIKKDWCRPPFRASPEKVTGERGLRHFVSFLKIIIFQYTGEWLTFLTKAKGGGGCLNFVCVCVCVCVCTFRGKVERVFNTIDQCMHVCQCYIHVHIRLSASIKTIMMIIMNIASLFILHECQSFTILNILDREKQLLFLQPYCII